MTCPRCGANIPTLCPPCADECFGEATTLPPPFHPLATTSDSEVTEEIPTVPGVRRRRRRPPTNP